MSSISKRGTGGGGGSVTSVTGTADRITATPTTGAVVVDIAATYAGQTSIDTVGTVTTGTWEGSVVEEPFGGTGQSTYTTGDILYSPSANTLTKLPIGTSNQVLTVNTGVPSWENAASGGVTSFSFTDGNGFDGTVTNPTTTADLSLATSVGTNEVIYANAGALTGTGVGEVGSRLITDSTGVPTWNNNSTVDISYFEDDFYYWTNQLNFGVWEREKDTVNIFQPSTSTPGHPGVWPIWVDAGNTAMNLIKMGNPSDGQLIYPGVGYISLTTIIKIFDLATATEDYNFIFGFGDFGIFSTQPGPDAIYFQYNRSASTSWQAFTKASGSSTTSSGTFPVVDADWHRFTIEINAAGTLVNFYIDGTLIGSSAANIPTAGMTLGYYNKKGTSVLSTPQEIQVDYVKYFNQLTTSRFS